MTVEEIEIIVTAKVQDALKPIMSLKPEIQKIINDIQKTVNSTSFEPLAEKTKEVSNEVGKAFNPETIEKSKRTISGYRTEMVKLTEATKQANKSQEDFVPWQELAKNKKPSNPNAYQYEGAGAILQKEYLQQNTQNTQETQPIENTQKQVSVWDMLKNKVEQVKISMEQFNAQLNSVKYPAQLNEVNYKISEIEEKLQNPQKFNMNTGDIIKAEADLERLKTKKEQLESQSGGSIFSKMGSAISEIVSKAKLLPGLFSKSKQSIGQMSSGLKGGFKTLLRYVGAMAGLRSAIMTVRQSASAWLSSQNAEAQQLSANINYMKYALGSTFAPILQYVTQLAYNLLKAIQSVVYALTKVNIFAKASASSMKSTAGSASKTSKSLSGIHSEINNVSESSGSSGSSDTSPSMDLSEMGDVSGGILDAIKNGDWSGVGVMIADKLNSAMDSIPWDSIKAKARTIGTNIAFFLNGFIGETDWSGVGNTIAQGINTAINFAYGFLSTFDFAQFGSSLSTTLMSLINNIDWGLLAKTISAGITGLLDFATGFIRKLDWHVVLDAILTFIGNIDWNGISDSIFEYLGTAVGSIVNLGAVIGGYIKQAFNGIEQYFQDKIEECGGNVVGGILKGIGDAVIGIGQWIYDHIFKPFINGFKSTFGIHSPSTVMAEMGGYIIKGLLNGITNLIGKISEIWTNIKTKMKEGAVSAFNAVTNVFGSLGSKLQSIFSSAWTKVKNVFSSGGQVFEGIKDGITSTFKDIVNHLIDGINKVIAVPFNKIKSALDSIRNISIAGAKPFSGLPTITVPQIPKLASGNVAYEETLAIFGEYSNARSNPEITAPKNVLEDTFKGVLSDFQFNTQSSSGLNKLVIQFGSTQVGLDMDKLIRQARRQNGTAYASI